MQCFGSIADRSAVPGRVNATVTDGVQIIADALA